MPRAAFRFRRSGVAYVFFLGTALLVVVIGISALTLGRVQLRSAEDLTDSAQARLYARAAIEQVLLTLFSNSTWRDSVPHDAWKMPAAIGDGTYAWRIVDERNDNFTANRNAPVRIYGTGTSGAANWTYSVLVQPPLESLPTSIIVNGDMESGAAEPWWSYGDCVLEMTSNTDEYYSGTYGMMVKNRIDTWAGPRQTVTVQQGQSCAGQMWIRMKNEPEYVQFLLGIETEFGWEWFTLADTQVGTNWTQLTGTVTPTWSGTLISALLKVETTIEKKDFFMDDVSFAPAPSATGIIPGTWQREAQ